MRRFVSQLMSSISSQMREGWANYAHSTSTFGEDPACLCTPKATKALVGLQR